MKGIRKLCCLIAAIWILSVPHEAFAAGRDTVTLTPEGSEVSVELEMSNAQEERISAVSVSLQIDEESRDKIKAEFEFAGELSGAVQGCLYDKNTGVLNIYVASAGSLFDGEVLSLGYVQVTPEDPGQFLEVELSYIGSSFQTANEAYGDKAPVVMYDPEPVSMKVGNNTGTVTPEPGDGTGTGSGDGNRPGTPGGESGTDGGQGGLSGNGNSTGSGNSSGSGIGDNRNEGLYDENTQFKNDPSSAQQITSPVVRGDGQNSELADLSGKAAAGAGGGVQLQNAGGKWTGSAGKVSVISPEKGPAGIQVSKAAGTGTKNRTGWEEVSAKESGDDVFGDEENSFETGDSIPGETEAVGAEEAEGSDGEEIRLDQKNGGAADDSSKGIGSKVLAGAGIAAASGTLGAGGFLLVRAKGGFGGAEKRKKRKKKKRRKPAYKRDTDKGAKTGKPVSKKTVSKKPSAGKPVHKRRD